MGYCRPPAIDICKAARRAGGVKGGEAAERSEGTLDAAEHRAPIEWRWPDCRQRFGGAPNFINASNCRRSAGVIVMTRCPTKSSNSTRSRKLANSTSYGRVAHT